MEGRDEILQDWKEKFLNTYKVSLQASFIRICSFAGKCQIGEAADRDRVTHLCLFLCADRADVLADYAGKSHSQRFLTFKGTVSNF